MLRFGTQIAKISNRRKYPLYGILKKKNLKSNTKRHVLVVPNFLCSLYQDFAKAFDKAPHLGLIDKLNFYKVHAQTFF